jgi:hypothetical protein
VNYIKSYLLFKESLSTQIRYHSSKLPIEGRVDGNKIYPTQLKNRKSDEQEKDWSKPIGFWYGFGESWINLAKTEMEGTDFAFQKNPYHYEVHLKPNAKILVLDTRQKVDDFIAQYGTIEYINWSNFVSTGYQGIEFPNYDDLDLRILKPKKYFWLYSWDVNSGCVWDPEAIDYLVDVSQEVIDNQ